MAESNHTGRDLEAFHQKKLLSFLPVIIVMAVICVLGILGNAFTIAFYGFASRKSPTVFMITVLACVDLIVCVLIIPNMVEMGVNVKYTNAVACKVIHFFGLWTIESSGFILWFISIDRYRHVCCPLRSQVNYAKAKVAMGIIIFVSFLLSVRNFANFVTIEVPIPNSSDVGHYCTTTEDPNYKLSVTIFHAIDVLCVFMVLVTLFTTYSRIIWTINKGDLSSVVRHSQGQEKPSVSRKTQVKLTESDTSISHVYKLDETHKKSKNKKNSNGKGKVSSAIKIKKTERSITLMMFAVSLNFAVCFISYLIVKGIRSFKQASELELGAGIQFTIRLLYVNSLLNPYIFCIFNPQFRRFIRCAISIRSSTSSLFSQDNNVATNMR